MNEEAARWLLYGITAVAAVVWLAGSRFLGRSFGARPSREPGDRLGSFEASSANTIRDSVEVDGAPEELAAKAVSVVADRGAGPTGPVKIIEASSNRLVIEGGSATADPNSVARFFRRAEFDFRSSGGRRTRIDYEIQLATGHGLRFGGMTFQILGAVAIVVGFSIMQAFVVTNPNPAIRWQTFQMLQVVHFLWPPFLFGAIYRRGSGALREAFDVMLYNLPYHQDR